MSRSRLSVDEAVIALIILAMEVDQHASVTEAARAEVFVHELPRFKRHSRASIGKMIEQMRIFVRDHDDADIIAAVDAAIPEASRATALAVLLAMTASDGRLRLAETALIRRIKQAWALPHVDVTENLRGAPARRRQKPTIRARQQSARHR